MLSEWLTYTVSELQEAGKLLVEDGNHGEYRPRHNEFTVDGVAFIRAANLERGRILFSSASKINSTALNRIRKGIGHPHDVLLSHKGTVGKVALAPLECPPFVCSPQTTFWRTLDDNFLDARYLYYYILSTSFQQQLDARKGETDMADYVSLTTQRTLKVIVPPIEEQRVIANTLGILDEKIELNLQMDDTLEAMASTIFKSWFIDFDPIRTKVKGLQPKGIDAVTAELFPSTFENSELGEIPRGWKVLKFTEAAEITYGYPFKSNYFNTKDGMPIIRIRDLPNHFSPTLTPESYETCYVVQAGDVLIGMDGEFRAYYWRGAPALLNQRVCRVRPLIHDFPQSYLYFAIQSPLAFFESSQVGTTVIHLGKKELDTINILYPNPEILAKFRKITMPIFDKLVVNFTELSTLSVIRDTLLPKLLSGEIRFKEAEKYAEALL